jgi:hypothetical protein
MRLLITPRHLDSLGPGSGHLRSCRIVCAAGGLVALYALFLRRRILTWGASEVEANGPLPGDRLLEDADGVSTRAISIAAAPSTVWPWLAQMGPSPRGGAYTYDWIENLLGLNMHSTDRVLSEFQHPEVGETISFGSNVMRLEIFDPPRAIAWRSLDGNWVWSFQLEATPTGTRLLSRNRFRVPTLMSRIAMVPVEPGSLIMERKMLLGIRDRAERLASTEGHSG